MTVRIAFYDLDRTVTRLPTWTPFLLFAAARTAPWRLLLLPAIGLAALARTAGLLSRDRLKEAMHALMLGRTMTGAAETELVAAFSRHTLVRNVRPGARRRIAADHEAGYRVVLATAAHRFYAEPIARGLGIADVIATEATRSPGGALGSRLLGANVYGEAKLSAVRAWLQQEGTARDQANIRFYSDHITDVPCLEFADEPYVVNPTSRFRAMAEAKGWQVLDWNLPESGEPVKKAIACVP
ncbi:HAD family hydrolase [Sphingomonas sp. Mn802worker]|uniref:HAD family hydrolase n=1 Tax=Sphingomonas sp. Mn802worker TaxID=629773 RepID=UPI00036FFE6E|nr:HAD-IB family hydrolase [Sphingomonas sp. Mn802worker]